MVSVSNHTTMSCMRKLLDRRAEVSFWVHIQPESTASASIFCWFIVSTLVAMPLSLSFLPDQLLSCDTPLICQLKNNFSSPRWKQIPQTRSADCMRLTRFLSINKCEPGEWHRDTQKIIFAANYVLFLSLSFSLPFFAFVISHDQLAWYS